MTSLDIATDGQERSDLFIISSHVKKKEHAPGAPYNITHEEIVTLVVDGTEITHSFIATKAEDGTVVYQDMMKLDAQRHLLDCYGIIDSVLDQLDAVETNY